jgi:TRAP-type C4-dicarboxylate transport system permease small subunit
MAVLLQLAAILEGAAAVLAAGALGVFTVVVILEVIARYVLNAPIIWSNEVATYLFIYAVFFGGSVALKRRDLMDVRLVRERSPIRVQWLMTLVTHLVILGFSLAGTFHSGTLILTSIRTGTMSPALEIPMLYVYLPIPIGFSLMGLFSLANFLQEAVAGPHIPPRPDLPSANPEEAVRC